MKIEVTQVTFLTGEVLVAGVPVDDGTKLVIASAPMLVGLEIAAALSDGQTVITAEPPEEDIRAILEQP